MVVVPSVNALTIPLDDTDATDGFDVVHDTLVPPIVSPFWSFTVAVSCAVCPNASKLKLVADNEIDVGTAASGVVGPVPLSPHARTSSSRAAKPRTLNLRVSSSFLDPIADKCTAILSLLYRGLNEFVM